MLAKTLMWMQLCQQKRASACLACVIWGNSLAVLAEKSLLQAYAVSPLAGSADMAILAQFQHQGLKFHKHFQKIVPHPLF